MAELPVDLDKKAGPFTTAQWAAIIGAGVGIGLGVRWWRNRNGGDVAPPAADEHEDPTPDDEVVYLDEQPDPLFGSPISSQPWPTPAVGGPTSPTAPGWVDNDMWGQAAISELIKRGKSPTASANAIGKFLNSEGLTYDERALVDLALKLIGVPPEPVASQPLDGPPPSPVPKPQPKPTPAPTQPKPAPAPGPQYNYAPPVHPQPAALAAADPLTRWAWAQPQLTIGSNGPAVKAVAQWLNVYQKRSGARWLHAENSGVMDTAMAQAVREFQAEKGETQNGVVHPPVWAQMKATGLPVPAF